MMKETIKVFVVLSILTALSPKISSAGLRERLDSFFQEKISSFESKLSTSEQSNQGSVFPAMTLSDINVQLGTTVSFGITSVLDLSISPEVDFIVTPAAN
jgi:hypothetical protein